MSTDNLCIKLPLARYRFNFVAESPIQLPAYSGSAWRGLFGHALKRTVCVTHERDCKQCLLWRSCVYSYVFETPPPVNSEVMRKYNAAPHPFVISPNPYQVEEIQPDEPLFFDFVLIGKANQHLPYIIHAMQQAGLHGIGRQRGKFSLVGIEQDTNVELAKDPQWQTIYSAGGELVASPPITPIASDLPDGELVLTFTTPFRSVQQGQLIRKDTFRLQHLLSNLMRRLSMLCYFHTDTPLKIDFKALTEKAKNIELVSNDLQWHNWNRYSSRQKSKIQMGGVVGQVGFLADAIQPFWAMLSLGQIIHAGKGTVMGLGKFNIETIE
jgi:hypothetical protein